MQQREVQDEAGMRWSCVQALGGLQGAAAEAAADKLEGEDGRVPVSCTPSGGAASVRIELPRGWQEGVGDDDLLAAIAAAQQAG